MKITDAEEVEFIDEVSTKSIDQSILELEVEELQTYPFDQYEQRKEAVTQMGILTRIILNKIINSNI